MRQIVISGGCTIGRNSFIGVNATLRDHIVIAPENIIGAGAIILKDTKDKEIYKLDAKGVVSKLKSDEIKF